MDHLKCIGIAGVLISHIGFVLIFYFGSPFRRMNGGALTLAASGPTKEGEQIDSLYKRLAAAGFFMVCLGATAQVVTLILQ